MRVDLPAPFGPSRPMERPVSAAFSRSRMTRSPKRTSSPSSSITGSMNLSKRRLGPACSLQLRERQGASRYAEEVSAQQIGHALAQHIPVAGYCNPVQLAVGGYETGFEIAQVLEGIPPAGPGGHPRAAKSAQKPGQRGQRGAQVLVDDGGEVDVAIARHHGEEAGRALNRSPGGLHLERASYQRPRRPGDQVAAGEGVMRLRQ